MNDHLSGKKLFIRLTAHAVRKLLSIYAFRFFPFGFAGRIWDLIVSVPDHCLSFYSVRQLHLCTEAGLVYSIYLVLKTFYRVFGELCCMPSEMEATVVFATILETHNLSIFLLSENRQIHFLFLTNLNVRNMYMLIFYFILLESSTRKRSVTYSKPKKKCLYQLEYKHLLYDMLNDEIFDEMSFNIVHFYTVK